MKIRFKSNRQVISCKFNLDLTKNNAIERIMKLFGVSKVYVSIYGMKAKLDLSTIIETLSPTNCLCINSPKSLCDIALEVNASHLTPLLHILANDFDEMIVWSCYTDWNLFINELIEPSVFFTFTAEKLADYKPSFYLHYSPYDWNEVEIICDKQLKDNITKDDLLRVLQRV